MTVNIADFRCRAIKRRPSDSPQSAGRLESAYMVLSRPEPKVETHTSPALSRVCDIGIAREAQRLRSRMVTRPIQIQRRANVIRFGQQKIRLLSADQHRRLSQWPIRPDDPGDFTPAA